VKAEHVQVFLFTLLACVLTSCLSVPREREAHCLAATMTDFWETEQEFTLAEQAWRAAQRDQTESREAPRASSARSLVADSNRTPFSRKGTLLYQRMASARARHVEAAKSYRLLARRVQTRIEEDDMLFPVLGMLIPSTAIVLYPLVRWNVRSVLWDGTDPDAEDDPVQRFCMVRLGEASSLP